LIKEKTKVDIFEYGSQSILLFMSKDFRCSLL